MESAEAADITPQYAFVKNQQLTYSSHGNGNELPK